MIRPPMSSFTDIERLIGDRMGRFDVPCPVCGPGKQSPKSRTAKKLRIWRKEDDFATFKCARCDLEGHARREGTVTRNIDPQEYRRRQAEADRREDEEKRDRTRRALAIWEEAEPIDGTMAAGYLAHRGVAVGGLPDNMEHVLRFHPQCPWQGGYATCMVALWTDTVTGVPRAIHRTAIDETGKKIGSMSLGPTAGCVIRLWPDDAVSQGLVIGEGIETVLAAATRVHHRGTLLQPAWACGDKGHLAAFPVLAGVEDLTILVDNDESGAGQEAAAECTARWIEAGREVTRLIPRLPGNDFNDLVNEAAP